MKQSFSRIFLLFALMTESNVGSVMAEPLRVGIPGLSAEFTPVWAAQDRGLLKKYGFETEIIAMQGAHNSPRLALAVAFPLR